MTDDRTGCTDIIRPDTARITELLKTGSAADCRGTLDGVLDGMRFREMKSLMLRLYACTDIYMTARSFTREIGISDERFAERFGTVEVIEPRLRTTEDMIDFLYEILVQCIEWRGDIARESAESPMRTALCYIEKSFMNCKLSLGNVADAVGLSPSYLSMLFKRETGENFSDCLTRVRINKAKELLCCTSKMVYEVAYDVGFSDYRYFSQIFKKKTGMTPRQYQYSMNYCEEKQIS